MGSFATGSICGGGMFSSEIDHRLHTLSQRLGGIVLGSILMVGVTASMISARTTIVSFLVLALGFLAAGIAQRGVGVRRLRGGEAAWALAALLCFAAVSSLWSDVPSEPLGKVGAALLVGVGAVVIFSSLADQRRPSLLHIGEGLWLGFTLGVAYLLVEVLTDQAIKIAAYNLIGIQAGDLKPPPYTLWNGGRLIGLARDDLSRNIAPAALLLWPTLLVMRGCLPPSIRRAGAIGLGLLTAFVVLASPHAASKLALIAGFIAFGIAAVSPVWARRVAGSAWVLACLGVVPAVLGLYRLDLHHSQRLQPSARHRIVIWNHTAETMLQRPLLGVGASMTYIIGPQQEQKHKHQIVLPETLSTHSHNVYLQTWFELGLVGATLLALFGLALVSVISGLQPVVQPYGYAAFASGMAMAGVSYGMWQQWFLALFALSAVSIGIGARLLRAPDASAAREGSERGVVDIAAGTAGIEGLVVGRR